MKKPAQHLIAEVPRRQPRVAMTIGVDLGDVWSHYCTLNQDGEVVDLGRFRTTPNAIEKWFTDVPPARVAMEAGTHSIWISEQLQELGHEVIVANVRELRAISHSDRKSDQVDAEKLARYARLDPEILRPISHRTVEQQEALTLIRARNLIVRLRTAAVNGVRGLTKSCGHRMRASTTGTFAKRSLAVMPPGLAQALRPVVEQIAEMTLKIKQYDRQIQQLGQTEYPETQALLKVHGVGHLTALTLVLTLGSKERFKQSRDVGCYLGLRPRRSQSGDRDPQLGITKAGNERPNELWQMDFKGQKESNAAIGPLSVLDDHSRYLVALQQTGTTRSEVVRERLEGIFHSNGLPEAMLMDHGVPWWSARAASGWTQLMVWLMKHGMRCCFSGMRHPQTQGKVERFHGALERARSRPDAGLWLEQSWLDNFRYEYNQLRPHEALGMQPRPVYGGPAHESTIPTRPPGTTGSGPS
jgi:transposase